MNDRIKIDCAKEADRDTLVTILARNGYTVRQGREKRGKSSNYTHYVEYWKEGKAPLRSATVGRPTPSASSTSELSASAR